MHRIYLYIEHISNPRKKKFVRSCKSYNSRPVTRARPYRSYLIYLDHQVGIGDLFALFLHKTVSDWWAGLNRESPDIVGIPFEFYSVVLRYLGREVDRVITQ